MSSGVYGTIRPSDFIPNEHAEVWLSYKEDRTSTGTGFSLVDTSKFLTREMAGDNHISGLYQLKLPLDVFNKVGVYNIYIRPKQITTKIQDVGVLASYPDIRGLVLNTSNIVGLSNIENDGLIGYRIEYFDSNGNKRPNLFRIITSNNKCEPINQINSGNITYRFNDNSNLIFLTLTPSSATNARPLSLPFIGNIQDSIIISNTFFNPEMIEIELTENDIESLYLSINGNQVRTLDNGIVTTYDKNNNIVNQVEHFVIKESATGTPVYEVKQNKTDIDFNQNFNDIVSNI